MWQTKDQMTCEMKNVMIWGRFLVHHEADKNSNEIYVSLFRHSMKKYNELSRWKGRGWRIWNELWMTNRPDLKFQGVSPVERQAKEDRNGMEWNYGDPTVDDKHPLHHFWIVVFENFWPNAKTSVYLRIKSLLYVQHGKNGVTFVIYYLICLLT